MKKKHLYRLRKGFELGYHKATKTLSEILDEEIYYNNFHKGVQPLSSFSLDEIIPNRLDHLHYAITVKWNSGFFGKGYLLFSQDDFNFFCKNIQDDVEAPVRQETFLKGLAAVLSSAVIDGLSQEFNCDAKCNPPVIENLIYDDLTKVVRKDFWELSDSVYVNAIFFSFAKKIDVAPIFMWVIEDSVLSITENG